MAAIACWVSRVTMVVTSRLGAIKREAENFIIYIFHSIQMISIIII